MRRIALAAPSILALLILIAATGAVVAHAANSVWTLGRAFLTDTWVAGELVTMTLNVTNGTERAADYTLIEEIPPELAVIEAGRGVYNQVAGFIVWQGRLEPRQSVALEYVAQIRSGEQTFIPLFAYLSTSDGTALDDWVDLSRVEIPLQIELSATWIRPGEGTSIQVNLSNPLNRPLILGLDVNGITRTQLQGAWPDSIELGPNERWQSSFELNVQAVGAYPISAQPTVLDVPAGPRKQVTLTVHEDHRPKALPQDETAYEAQRTPARVQRTHKVHLPSGLVSEGTEIMVVVPLPYGAVYVPNSARTNDGREIEPVIRQGYLLFAVPYTEEIAVGYQLHYEDARTVGALSANDQPDQTVGLIALEAIPRLLRGEQTLLSLLQGEIEPPPRERRGVVITRPVPGQIFTERQQIDIEVDAPQDSVITLSVNGEEISKDRVGAVGVDAAMGRIAEVYIAVPLRAGANQLTAKAVTAEGEELTDSIVVYRSGSPAVIRIDPVSKMITDSVQPLIVQITVTDKDGLPPADGTMVTLALEGSRIETEDARPDWVGHQVPLIAGRNYVQIASPSEAGVLRLKASIGDIEVEERLVVTSQADRWFVVGHGLARVDGILSRSERLEGETRLRLFARGPIGPAVFTAAIDTDGLGERAEDTGLWTGDNSEEASFGGESGIIQARLESGLSYLHYGKGAADFEGQLTHYSRTHSGLIGVWRQLPWLTLRGFVAQEPTDRIEEEFDGDGTGYYRLAHGSIAPYSEEIAIILRAALSPHDILHEKRLTNDQYTIDYRTGQILLREPLAGHDANGNRQSLRARYSLLEDQIMRTVGGVQATVESGPFLVQTTARRMLRKFGSYQDLIALQGRANWKEAIFEVEAAALDFDSEQHRAYVTTLSHPNLFGWDLSLSHRRVPVAFDNVGKIHPGVVTSLKAERTFGGGAHLEGQASIERDDPQSPMSYEAALSSRWSWWSLRPQLTLKASGGEKAPTGLMLGAGADLELGAGSIGYTREQPLIGDGTVQDLIKGRYDLSQGLALTATTEIKRETHEHSPRSRSALGLTRIFERPGMQTEIKGVYEATDDGMISEGAMVYGAKSEWSVNERHTLTASLERRQPVQQNAAPGMGIALDWSYKANQNENTIRFERHSEGKKAKQSVTWQAQTALGSNLLLRGDGLWTFDSPGRTRNRLNLSTAYRGSQTTVLGGVTLDEVREAGGSKLAREWRIKAAHALTERVYIHAGHARRTTQVPTTTDKFSLGGSVHLTDRTSLSVEGSMLRQPDTQTGQMGAMVGISHELAPDLWLTLGYAIKDYVSVNSTGTDFAKHRKGLFIQLDFAFDETLFGWL